MSLIGFVKKYPVEKPILFWLLLLVTLVVIASTLLRYYVVKGYTFIVEAACDPATNVCYVRDCEHDYCPPNGYSHFTLYELPASAFPYCFDNSCSNVCSQAFSECTEVVCAPTNDELCSTL